MEVLQIISSISELEWFFNHCVKPLTDQNQGYMAMINYRKKINPELGCGKDRMLNQVVIHPVKGVFDFNVFKKKLNLLECNIEAYDDDNGNIIPYQMIRPYVFLQIHDERTIIDSCIKQYQNTIVTFNKRNLKDVTDPDSMVLTSWEGSYNDIDMSLTPDHLEHNDHIVHNFSINYRRSERMSHSQSYYWDFDLDFNDPLSKDDQYNHIYELLRDVVGIGNYVIISTSGGFHILTKQFDQKMCQTLKSELSEELKNYCSEVIKNPQVFIPIPGTINYKFRNGKYNEQLITVLNKYDFESGSTLY